jgi:cytoskeleton-associated protein 5
MLKTLDDADGTAREASAEGLGSLMKVVGEKMMRTYIDALDDIKKNKIMEYYGKAETKATEMVTKKQDSLMRRAPGMAQKKVTKEKVLVIDITYAHNHSPWSSYQVLQSSKPVTSKLEHMVIDHAPTFTATSSPLKRKPASKPSGESQSKKPALSTNRPEPTTLAKSAPGAPAKSNARMPTSGTEEVKYKFSPEDAESHVNQYIPLQLWNDIGSGQWKVRLAAMEALLKHFRSAMRPTDIEAEIVIRCLSKKPGWKEMNFQVMTKLYDIMQLLASACPSFSRSCVCIGIPGKSIQQKKRRGNNSGMTMIDPLLGRIGGKTRRCQTQEACG